MSKKITKDELYDLMKTFFVDDYETVERSRTDVNLMLSQYEINGYDYNDYCSICLERIKLLINNSSNEELLKFNLELVVMKILNNMIIDKLKTKDSPEIEEQILFLNNKINNL